MEGSPDMPFRTDIARRRPSRSIRCRCSFITPLGIRKLQPNRVTMPPLTADWYKFKDVCKRAGRGSRRKARSRDAFCVANDRRYLHRKTLALPRLGKVRVHVVLRFEGKATGASRQPHRRLLVRGRRCRGRRACGLLRIPNPLAQHPDSALWNKEIREPRPT